MATFDGSKLRAARLANGLTQAELARRANVRERQIIRWENDQHVPRAGSVKAVARVLGVPMASLFSDDEDGPEEDDGEAETLDEFLSRRIRALLRQELALILPDAAT